MRKPSLSPTNKGMTVVPDKLPGSPDVAQSFPRHQSLLLRIVRTTEDPDQLDSSRTEFAQRGHAGTILEVRMAVSDQSRAGLNGHNNAFVTHQALGPSDLIADLKNHDVSLRNEDRAIRRGQSTDRSSPRGLTRKN